MLLPWALKGGMPVKESFFLGSFLIVLYVAQMVGLIFTTASNSGFITGLFVLWVPVLGFFFLKQGLTRLQWLAVAIALFGLWVLTGGVMPLNLGDLLTFIASIASGAHVLAMEWAMRRRVDPLRLNFHQFWITGLFCAILAVILGLPFNLPDAKTLWVIFYLAAIPTVAAITIQAYAQKHVSSFQAALIFSLEPVFAAIFAWTVGGEAFSLIAALGGILMVAGAILGEWGKPGFI